MEIAVMTINRELVKSIIPEYDNVQQWKEWNTLMYADTEQRVRFFRWVEQGAEVWVMNDTVYD